jgi:nitroimidazol reductase NimA-like FMN-containing flavoprotein (pyridoxamine 5'-phosphate oxidase superfamily)
MRRSDRESTDPEKIREIIRACDCCRLGLADGGHVYIVPLNFGYIEDGAKRIFYFHGAAEGRKTELIRKNGSAGFELDTDHYLNEAEEACEYSFRFKSVIGEGKIGPIEDAEEKRAALRHIMAHYSVRSGWTFPDAMLEAAAVFKLEVESLTAKEHP